MIIGDHLKDFSLSDAVWLPFSPTLILSFPDVCTANPDAKRLFDDLLSSYNKLVDTFLGH